MHLADIMTTEIQSIRPDASLDDARDLMRHARIRHLVVMEGGRVVGILSDRDVYRARSAGERYEWTVADAMTPRVVTAGPDTTVRRAATLLRGHVIGCLPIVDGKRLLGIVTTSDLLALIAGTSRAQVADASAAPRARARARGTLARGAART